MASTLSTTLAGWSERSSDSDPRYFSDGVWHNDGAQCFRCDAGPGVAAAALAAGQNDSSALRLALSTFDTAIADNQAADGSFGPPQDGEGRPDIQTALFGNELGTAYLLLAPKLGATRAATWRAAIRGAADYLIANGNLHWYTNGNIVLANALNMQLAARITGDSKYQADYEEALAFATAPDQQRWPGYGLHLTRTPTKADGSDGAGYLTEKGLGDPGFDGSYTQFQMSVLARLYLVNKDPRVLRLMNLEMNELMPRVDKSSWLVDVSNGSRHPDPVRWENFTNGAMSVLAFKVGNTGLLAKLSGQTKKISDIYVAAVGYTNIGNYYGLGDEVTTAYLATTELLP